MFVENEPNKLYNTMAQLEWEIGRAKSGVQRQAKSDKNKNPEKLPGQNPSKAGQIPSNLTTLFLLSLIGGNSCCV